MRLIRWVAAPIAALLVGIALLGVANAATQNWVVDFEGLSEGATPGVLTPGLGITGPAAAPGSVTISGSSPMIFDSNCGGGCTGGDDDLGVGLGNVLIISEDGDAGDPDDSAFGGTLSASFSSFGVVTVDFVTVVDIEPVGSTISVFNGITLVGTVPVPVTGDGGTVVVAVGLPGDSVSVTLTSSGAIDNIAFTAEVDDPPPPPPAEPAEITVTKAGGEAGIDYSFQLTHGGLNQVDSFGLQSGDSHSQILFLAADYQVVEVGAPAGVTYSSGCSGNSVLPGASVTCTVTNPAAEVLGTTAIVEKMLTSADPAFVGESVTFTIATMITGDTTVTAGLVDTFEHDYLGFVSADPACVLIENMPDADHSIVACDIGEVTPGSSGSPGTLTFTFDLTFEALQPTTPARTVNSVVAVLGTDQIGPAIDDVEIIASPTLPPSGDGTLSDDAKSAVNIFAVAFASVVLAISGLWLGQGSVVYFGTRDLWQRDHS